MFFNYSAVCTPANGCHHAYSSQLEVRFEQSTDEVTYLGLQKDALASRATGARTRDLRPRPRRVGSM